MAYACLQFIQVLGIWLVLGSEDIYRTKQHHGLNDLVHDFSNIIQKPAAKFIDLNLDFEDAFDREASGVYKLIPYYMKIYPKDTNHGDRFIIQQNPFNGEFQLIKIFNYIYRKNVRSLFHPNKEIPQKKDLTTINFLHKYQTNMKALAGKNIRLIEEIQKTKEKGQNLKNNLQSKEKHLHENMEQEKKNMKEKKLKLKEEIFQLKLINKENEQKIYDLRQTLDPKQSLIDEQKIMIEKLKLELSQLNYEKECLQDENSNLTSQVKTAKENCNQNIKREKDKNKQFEKQQKELQKVHENIKQMHEKMSKLLEESHQESNDYKKKFETFQKYFENHYYNFSKRFPENFKKLSQIENKFRLKTLLCDEDSQYNSKFEYEHALIDYGFFKHAEYFRITNIIKIAKEAIFDPKKLELPTYVDCDNTHNGIHMLEEEKFDTPKKGSDHNEKK